MLARFSIRFTVIAIIAALAVSAPAVPRRRGKGNGISIPLTKHSSSLNSSRSVNIDGLKSHAASYTAKLLRRLENYERNTGTTHPYAWKQSGSRSRKRSGAALDLTGHVYDIWSGTILIGTPPKPFTVQIDTGSSDLFIPSSAGNEYCKSHDNLFNAALSATAQVSSKTFQLIFGDGGNVNGEQYTDVVTISGFTANKQTIGVATTYSADLAKSDRFPSDGLLGLAFQSISEYPASPLLQTLINEGKLPNEVFSLKLTFSGGELYMGGVNEELYSGDITYVNVPTEVPGFWQVIIEDIRVNGKPVLSNLDAIIDSGANYIYGDPDRVLKLHQAHGGKAFEDGYYTFPCHDFPDVAFTFGGTPFTIPGRELNSGPVTEGSPDCFSGIVARDHNDDALFWNLGSTFLMGFYTVYNMGSNPPQVGFAELVGA